MRVAVTMEDLIASIVAAALIIYLLWALINPERF
jgi:K+-transporting ATPase KdpF subunit